MLKVVGSTITISYCYVRSKNMPKAKGIKVTPLVTESESRHS